MRLSHHSTLLLKLCCYLCLVFSISANATSYRAQWIIDSQKPLESRMKNTLWLAVISDEPIAASMVVEPIKVKHLFIEKAKSGPIYTTRVIDGLRKHVAQMKYDIYPAKAGEFALPATKVTLGKGEGASTIYADTQQFNVVAQPEKARGLIVTSSLTLSQKLSDIELIAGGAVSREVSMKVADLPGYLIAELPLSVTDSASSQSVTMANSVTSSASFRGIVTGKRESKLLYRFTVEGQYQLPQISVSWWDPNKQQVEYSVLPAVDVTVRAAPPLPMKQRVSFWLSSFVDVIQAYQQYLVVMFVAILLMFWQRRRLISLFNLGLTQVKVAASLPLSQLLILTIKAVFCSKKKLPALYTCWTELLSISLQLEARNLQSLFCYQISGSVKVQRRLLLGQMIHINWLFYYQGFQLQPLNPK